MAIGNIKNEVLIRVYIIMLMVVAVAVAIYVRAVHVVVYEGEKWRARADSSYVFNMPIEPIRGNIMSTDGSLLATSLPYFEVRWDTNAKAITNDVFNQNVDSLALCMSRYVNPSFTKEQFKNYLVYCRNTKKERYLLIKKDANIDELDRMKHFPIFRNGRYKGGFVVIQHSNRSHPYGMMARRTLGYLREGALPVGLEASFNDVLGGEQGEEKMFKVSNNMYMPLTDLTQVEPKNGDDILTTLDVNLMDITQEALLRSLDYHAADHGCAIVMDIKTGGIKAISNLGRTEEGWTENYNYAVGSATEPGSTFKLASMMAMLEDGYIHLEDTIDLNLGKTKYYNDELVDSEKHGIRKTTVKHAFEMSSNVGISKLVQKYYGDNNNAAKFVSHLRDFNLDKPTGIDLSGEARPYIKTAYDKKDSWSGTTLPWMSIGYECMITPIQMLTFYAAVANDGAMMRPYLVTEVQRYGETIRYIKPEVISRRIASKRTLAMARQLLEGVIENGTGKDLQTDRYRFAGKTGTAQNNYHKFKTDETPTGYQASFAGYFPAENPVYACIVVVSDPKQNGYYGASVAGTVFREIADKAFTSKSELHNPINLQHKKPLLTAQMPSFDAGDAKDFYYLLDYLNINKYNKKVGLKSDWTVLQAKNDSLNILDRMISETLVPNVTGMRLKDALYLLENKGLKVEANGVGIIRRQSIPPGTKLTRGMYIALNLE